MKKQIKTAAALALALSAVTPVAAFAAETSVAPGVYTSTSFTSLTEFNAKPAKQKAQALLDPTAVLVLEANGKTVKADLILSASNEELAAATYATAAAYATANNVEFTTSGVKAPTATAGELKVESVSAINAQKIEVKFSQEVVGGASDAEDATKYTITGVAGVAVTAELQSDNKTVILSLNTPIVNDTTVAVTVDPVASKADATKSSERYTTSFKFNDTVKPTYVGFDNKTPGVVTVKFSEELAQGTIIPGNIVVTKADGTPITVLATGTPSTNQVLLTKKDNGFELSSLENNVEYKVAVKDVKDLSGNLTSPNVVNFTVKSTATADTVAPEVTDIVSKGLNHVVISVSEELKNLGTTTVPKYVTVTGEKSGVAQVYNKTAGTVTVELDPAITEGTVKTITVSTYEDLATNAGVSFTKSVGFSAISKVVKSEVVAKTTAGVTEDFVKVTFDKDIQFTAPSAAVSATLLTKDNVEKTISIPVANFDQGAPADKELNVLYIKVENLSDLEEGKLSIPVTKTVVTTLSADAKAEVDYKAIASDLTAPALDLTYDTNGIDVVGGKFVVKYTQDMGQSALDVNNYTVDGVKVFESAIFKADKKTVELTLKPNALPLTADYDVKISKAVANEKGVSLKADYITTENITETVQPELKKAALAADGGTVTLTFSEAVNVSANAFELFVDGTKVATTVNAITSGSEAPTVTINVTSALTAAQIAKTLTVKAATGAAVKDAAGNALKAFEAVNVSLLSTP